MVHQPVNGGNGHHRVGKDSIPLTKGLIRRDHHTLSFIAMGNEFKQNRGFHIRFFDIAEIVNDEEIVAVKFGQCGL